MITKKQLFFFAYEKYPNNIYYLFRERSENNCTNGVFGDKLIKLAMQTIINQELSFILNLNIIW
jgi:hypothetical protein